MSDYFPDIDAAVASLPLFAPARKTDPSTSHQAARRAPVRGHAAKVLEALRAGPAGQTEIGRRTGLLPHQVNKRLNDLRLAGLVEVTGRKVEGGAEREWRVK
jgi:predicted Rossmann fold nucleotide-binding protein DprA/Smf involved in DNA uptake